MLRPRLTVESPAQLLAAAVAARRLVGAGAGAGPIFERESRHGVHRRLGRRRRECVWAEERRVDSEVPTGPRTPRPRTRIPTPRPHAREVAPIATRRIEERRCVEG